MAFPPLPEIPERPADRPETLEEYQRRREILALHRQLRDELSAWTRDNPLPDFDPLRFFYDSESRDRAAAASHLQSVWSAPGGFHRQVAKGSWPLAPFWRNQSQNALKYNMAREPRGGSVLPLTYGAQREAVNVVPLPTYGISPVQQVVQQVEQAVARWQWILQYELGRERFQPPRLSDEEIRRIEDLI